MDDHSDPRVVPRLVDLLDLAERTVGACLTRLTEDTGLTREQWRTLVLLNSGADPATGDGPGHTMGEIAARAGVPAPTATRMVDRLVADGLAYRLSDPWDRRRVLVHLASAGRDVVERAALSLDDTLRSAFEQAPSVDRLDVVDLLRRLAGATEAAGPAAPADATVVSH